jgi:hypothetical protein
MSDKTLVSDYVTGVLGWKPQLQGLQWARSNHLSQRVNWRNKQWWKQEMNFMQCVCTGKGKKRDD